MSTIYLNHNEIKLLLNGLGESQVELSTQIEGLEEQGDDYLKEEILKLQAQQIKTEKLHNKLTKKLKPIQIKQ